VHLRRGGERCAAGGHHRTLKALFQERGVPPWLRPRIPLVYRGERLVAVAGVAACGPPPAPGEPGLRLDWRDAMTALAPQEEPPAHAEPL
jgi:tRNA(Ile)-lysidine synthase